jgi:hypothetical protein
MRRCLRSSSLKSCNLSGNLTDSHVRSIFSPNCPCLRSPAREKSGCKSPRGPRLFSLVLMAKPRPTGSRYHLLNSPDRFSQIDSVRQVLFSAATRIILQITISASPDLFAYEFGTYGIQNWNLDWIVDAHLQLLSFCGWLGFDKWIESAKITRSSFRGWRRVGRKDLRLD